MRDCGDGYVAHGPVLDIGVAATGGEQAEEVGLARAVRTQDRDPLTEPHLEVERAHQPRELEPLTHDRALARAATDEPHAYDLLAGDLLRRPDLLELRQTGLRRLVAARETVVELRLHLVHQHERLELRVLLIPPAPQLLEPGEAIGAC